MKTLFRFSTALLLAASACAAAAQTVTIRYSSWLPTTHWILADPIVPYLHEIEKVTEGRVKVDVLPKMVGTPPTQFDVVRDGLADMSWFVIGYTPGRFKLAEMGELPFGGDSAAMYPAFQRVYAKHFARHNEFKGVEMLGIWAVNPSHVGTRTKPVRTADDFKGIKLRTAGETATRALTLLGGVPILKNSAEAFEMLSTGAIDGSMLIPETVVGSNLLGLLKHYTVIPGGIAATVHGMAINPDKWSQISAKDQQAIRGISGEKLALAFGRAFEKQNRASFEAMKKAGYTIDEVSPAVASQLKENLKPIENDWVQAAKAKGVTDPAAVLNEYRAEIQKINKAGN